MKNNCNIPILKPVQLMIHSEGKADMKCLQTQIDLPSIYHDLCRLININMISYLAASLRGGQKFYKFLKIAFGYEND